MNSLIPERCSKRVYFANSYGEAHQCTRKIWRGEWCKIHHPDSIELRNEKSQKRWDEQKKLTPWYKLEQALLRIKELEAEIVKLKLTPPDRAREG